MQSQNKMMLEDGICTIGFIDNQFILLWAHIYFTTYEYSLLYLNMFLYQSQLCYQAIYLSYEIMKVSNLIFSYVVVYLFVLQLEQKTKLKSSHKLPYIIKL